jgi:protein-S-isoprenylcysteine O-methyltransferase Ste14
VTFSAVLEKPVDKPASATTQWVNWIGVICFFLVLAAGLRAGLSPMLLFPVLLAAYALPIAGYELAVQRGHLLPEMADGWAARTITRTLAHYFTFAVLVTLVWALPWYQVNFLDSIFAAVPWQYAVGVGMLLLFLTPFYLLLVDHDPLMPEQKLDGGLALGDWLAGRRGDPRQRDAILQHVLAWTVKLFFIPVMIGLAWVSLEEFSGWKWPEAGFDTPLPELRNFSHETAIYLMGFLDVTIALVGYLCTLRLFNSHIRSTDTSGFGWLVCIVCYGPWWVMFYEAYADYDDDSYWQDWLSGLPDALTWIWGGLIVFFTFIYVWSTIAFGIRFSNLTNRGIITDGPYSLVKHPAYLSKNIFFWLTSVPFVVTDSVSEAVRLSLLLVLVNILYFFRAKTEEKHLRSDPAYVAYESWLAQNGLWAKVRRLVTR